MNHPDVLEFGDPTARLQVTQPDDGPALYDFINAHGNRAHIGAYEPWARHLTPDNAIRRVGDACNNMAEDLLLHYWVMRRTNPDDWRIAGATLLRRSLLDDRPTFELGYYLGSEDLHQGLATRGCRRLLEYAREAWDARYIRLAIDATNTPSQEVARRLGATLFRPTALERGGKLLDEWQLDMGPRRRTEPISPAAL